MKSDFVQNTLRAEREFDLIEEAYRKPVRKMIRSLKQKRSRTKADANGGYSPKYKQRAGKIMRTSNTKR